MMPAVQTSPLDQWLVREQTERIGEAVASLPHVWRTVVFLHYYEDRTIAEIAETVSLSPERVSRVHEQALDHLRDVFL